MYDKDIALTKRRIGTVERPLLLSRPICIFDYSGLHNWIVFLSAWRNNTTAKGRISELLAAQNQCTKNNIFIPGS